MADKFIELQEMLGVDSTGKPLDRSYLQAGLPDDLQQSIENLENVTNWLHVDLLQDELYADINAAFISKEISTECADYLRDKYLPSSFVPRALQGKKRFED